MSTTFTDSAGRSWNLALNFTAAQRVKDVTGVNLLSGTKAIEALLDDDGMRLVGVVMALCQPAMEERGLSDLDFGEGLDGDAIDAATTAFLEAFVNFTRPAKRPALRRLLAKVNEIEHLQTSKAESLIDGGALDTLVERELARMEQAVRGAESGERRAESQAPTEISGPTSTGSPAPSESTPAR